jgi:hypothetical protein
MHAAASIVARRRPLVAPSSKKRVDTGRRRCDQFWKVVTRLSNCENFGVCTLADAGPRWSAATLAGAMLPWTLTLCLAANCVAPALTHCLLNEGVVNSLPIVCNLRAHVLPSSDRVVVWSTITPASSLATICHVATFAYAYGQNRLVY